MSITGELAGLAATDAAPADPRASPLAGCALPWTWGPGICAAIGVTD
jgi:hypothetical protein